MVEEEPSSPSAVDEERQRSSQTGDERIAVGGEATCRHPASDLVALGVGAPLRFERCGGCGAVLVGRLGGRAE